MYVHENVLFINLVRETRKLFWWFFIKQGIVFCISAEHMKVLRILYLKSKNGKFLYFVIQIIIIIISILVLEIENTRYFQSFVINIEIQNTFICSLIKYKIFACAPLKCTIQNTIVLQYCVSNKNISSTCLAQLCHKRCNSELITYLLNKE